MTTTSIVTTLDSFATLKSGWDGYQGEPIKPEVLAKAKEMIAFLPDWKWQAIPCPDGSIQLEMHENGFDIEITILK